MATNEKAVLLKLGMKLSASGKRTLVGMHKKLGRLQKVAGRALTIGGGIATAGAGMFIAMAAKGTRDAYTFGKAMSEVSTLVDTQTVSMRGLHDEVLALSRDTGQAPVALAKGLYQTISAGIDAGNAMKFLGQATRAAIGGVAEVTEAVDLGTNVLNAYGMSASETGRVFDIAFATVKEGKTTFSELAASMGGVLPIAAQLDVGLENIFAGVATLTKGGIDTATAVTYLRGALVAVLKPSGQASALAKRLKIDFSAAGLKAKGFAGFLDDIKVRTGGSAEALATLFPRVQGLTAVMAITGKQADTFAEILENLKNSAGASGEAFSKIAASDFHQFDKALNNLKVTGIALGERVLPGITKALDFMTPILGQAIDKLNELIDAHKGSSFEALLAAPESLAFESGRTGVKKEFQGAYMKFFEHLNPFKKNSTDAEIREQVNLMFPPTPRELGEGEASARGPRYSEFANHYKRIGKGQQSSGIPGVTDQVSSSDINQMIFAGTGIEAQGSDMATVVVQAQQQAVDQVAGKMKDTIRTSRTISEFIARPAYQ